MRLAEILGCRLHDADGHDIGGVHDVSFTADDAVGGEKTFRVAAVIVGGAAVGHRLGYVRHQMTGPWPLKWVLRRIAGKSYLVDWDDVVSFDRPVIKIRRRRDELPRINEIHQQEPT